ncbi:hypothetical protein [Staphylococcus epidermidis]|nr:hypothetical protein [Staphylococcus epidermidis]
MIYKFKDVEGGEISVDSESREVGKRINGIRISRSENSKDVLSRSVRGVR